MASSSAFWASAPLESGKLMFQTVATQAPRSSRLWATSTVSTSGPTPESVVVSGAVSSGAPDRTGELASPPLPQAMSMKTSASASMRYGHSVIARTDGAFMACRMC